MTDYLILDLVGTSYVGRQVILEVCMTHGTVKSLRIVLVTIWLWKEQQG
jgi:hypothetical protein